MPCSIGLECRFYTALKCVTNDLEALVFIRPRKSNLSLERPLYQPAVKDAQGKLLKLPKRSTLYLGSVKAHARFRDVPEELLDKLTDEEREQLRKALQPNEPRPDQSLSVLPYSLNRATDELRSLAADKSPENIEQLKLKLRAVETAWNGLLKTAYVVGLRRKVKKKPAVKGQG